MKQVIWIISCYLYGVAAILLVILLLLVYLRGRLIICQIHFPKRILRIGSQCKQEESCLARN